MVISRKLEVLDDYVKLFNSKNSDQISPLSTLIKGFGGEEKVWALLQTAKAHVRTKEKAKEMETTLFSKWIDEGQLPVTVFQWLKLYDDVGSAFTADYLNKFVKYVDDFNLKDSNSKKSALEIYTNSFGEADVTNKLVSAVNNEATSTVAKNLQEKQLKGWIKNKKSVDNVFAILKIKMDDDARIISRKLDVLEEFIKRKDGEQKLIKTMTEKFGSDSKLATILEKSSMTAEATTLQKKQFATFMNRNVRPENFMSSVFKTGIGSATEEQKKIAAKFNVFYKSQSSG